METPQVTHKFSNHKKIIALSDKDWQSAKTGRICELNVTVKKPNYFTDQYGRDLHHFCTTSYLGLDYHPQILEGAIQGLTTAKTLRIANSKNRCKLDILEQYETTLSTLFNSIQLNMSKHLVLQCSQCRLITLTC